MTEIENKVQLLRSQGFECGTPIGFETALANGGSFLTYSSGVTVYFHPNTGAHEVHGLILGTYITQLGPLGELGYPISDEHDDIIGGSTLGKVSDFERGSIFYSSQSGQTSLMKIGPVSAGTDFEIIDGLDVSGHQGTIDWVRVANTHIKFAYIKATEGSTVVDGQFQNNWVHSKGVVLRGAYHFFRFVASDAELHNQADHFLRTSTVNGDPGEIPPMIDVEELPANVTALQATTALQNFLSYLESRAGTRPIIYTYPSFWKHKMNDANTFATSHHLWIANYGDARSDGGFNPRTISPLIPGGCTNFTIWQNAVLPGISGIRTLVDRNTIIIPGGSDLASVLNQNP